MADLAIDINKLTRGEVVGTVRVTGMRRWNLRLSMALMFIRLAGWLAPVDFAIEDDRD